MAVLPLLLLPAVLLLPVVTPLRQLLRRRKKVRFALAPGGSYHDGIANTVGAEKEESDEDMGFGLFD